jgi:hypothetical protein
MKCNLEGLLARVLTNVGAENAGGGEGLVAVDTLVRPLATVHTHVLVQTRGLTEALAAHAALVRPMLLVHVQDVNAEAVALLERARAQMTRKLAVALVHTPRVLEMLVAVVLVGEHLPAPVTRVPVFAFFFLN